MDSDGESGGDLRVHVVNKLAKLIYMYCFPRLDDQERICKIIDQGFHTEPGQHATHTDITYRSMGWFGSALFSIPLDRAEFTPQSSPLPSVYSPKVIFRLE